MSPRIAEKKLPRHVQSNDASTALLFNGAEMLIRSITPADASREAAFLSRLPPECHDFRFLGLVRQNGKAAAALTQVDPEVEVSLIGLVKKGDEDVEVGVARFCTRGDRSECDCTVVVDPAWRGLGVGSALLERLIVEARRRRIRRMYSFDPMNAHDKHWLAEHMGFHRRVDPEDPEVTTYELELGP